MLLNNEELLREYQTADENRKTEIEAIMLEENSKLVYAFLSRGGILTDDNFQEGMIGLLEAVRKFDTSTDNKFSTYATYWIMQKTNRAYKNSHIIRIPVYAHGNVEPVKVTSGKFRDGEGMWTDILDTFPVGEPEILEEKILINTLINKFTETISERDKEIFLSRFIKEETLEVIGEKLGITKEWVRQRINKIRTYLTKFFKSHQAGFLLEDRVLKTLYL